MAFVALMAPVYLVYALMTAVLTPRFLVGLSAVVGWLDTASLFGFQPALTHPMTPTALDSPWFAAGASALMLLGLFLVAACDARAPKSTKSNRSETI